MKQADVLTAIDDALDRGVAADHDPLTRELQELALALRADAPKPTPVFHDWLGEQVEAGFPKRRSTRPAWWQRLLQPAAAVGMVAAAVAVIAVAAGGLSGSPGSDDSASGGGGGVVGSDGGSAAESGGGSTAGSGGGSDSEAARKASGGESGDAPQAGRDSALALPPVGAGFATGRSDRKIERTVALELEMPVDEMARVAEQVTVVTNRHRGFVLSSSVSTGGDSAGGDFELRIPSARLRPAVRDLAALADVRTQSQTGRDVTREHVTVVDRLQAARAERRSLLRRLEVATTDAEAEALRQRLDLVSGEISRLRGHMRGLHLRTDYAVVTVSLLATEGKDGGGIGGGSFGDALGDAADLLVAVAGLIVRALAVLLPLGLVALLGWLAARVLRRRRRESALA